jgi:hypothetical protein
VNLNTRIFYDINHFARDTPWLQPIVSGFAAYGVVLFAVLLLAGWWSARNDADPARVLAAVWAAVGMLAALAVNQPVAAAVNETRPCQALRDIVVLHCNIGAHYPQDVLAGLALGGAVSVVGYVLLRPVLRSLLAALAGTPLRILIAPRQAKAIVVPKQSP